MVLRSIFPSSFLNEGFKLARCLEFVVFLNKPLFPYFGCKKQSKSASIFNYLTAWSINLLRAHSAETILSLTIQSTRDKNKAGKF
uniref:Ribosomal RNA processing protein 36 homolog n=1 Tax=Rhizophora mucronata TaxID=61149 RepID=A0A2P2JLH7_RHIMU